MSTEWVVRASPMTIWTQRGAGILPYQTDDGYWVFRTGNGTGRFVDSGNGYFVLQSGATSGEDLTRVSPAVGSSYLRFR